MKRLFIIVAAMMVVHNTNALIVSVQGEGEVPEEGLDLMITEGEENALTGDYTMELRGNLLTSAAQINVSIFRSASGLKDEFCCGSNCTAGNGTTEETKSFSVSGMADWYAHYVPAPNSDETVRYLFDDGNETREVRVRYVYNAEGINETGKTEHNTQKTLCNGQVLIRCNETNYTITGKQL